MRERCSIKCLRETKRNVITGLCSVFVASILLSLQMLPKNQSSPLIFSVISLHLQLHLLQRKVSESAATAGGGGQPWSYLKYNLIAALSGGVATTGYATYAYSLEEIDEKIKALPASPKVYVGDDLSFF